MEFVGTEQEIRKQQDKVELARNRVKGSLTNLEINTQDLFTAINELARLCSTK
jgi:hypothetical protein